MRRDGPPPTFSSRMDRLTYLLARYRWLVVALVLGTIAGLAWWQPSLPSLPWWVGPLVLANILLGIPGLLAGRQFARWLRSVHWEHVYEIDGLRGTREKWLVPPETWREKVVEDKPPNPVNDRQDWEVRRFEWEDDVETLRVEGTWPGEAKVGDLVTERTHFEEMHETLLDAYREFKRLRAKWSRMAMDQEGKVINEQAEAHERGTMVDPDAAKEVYKEAKDMADEDPLEELPELSDEQLRNGHHDPEGEPGDRRADPPGGEP